LAGVSTWCSAGSGTASRTLLSVVSFVCVAGCGLRAQGGRTAGAADVPHHAGGGDPAAAAAWGLQGTWRRTMRCERGCGRCCVRRLWSVLRKGTRHRRLEPLASSSGEPQGGTCGGRSPEAAGSPQLHTCVCIHAAGKMYPDKMHTTMTRSRCVLSAVHCW
jgi:hypothetical protein